MVRLAQTVHLSRVKISTISKWIETNFNLSLVPKEYVDIYTKLSSLAWCQKCIVGNYW
jgi:hypothetical protein